MRKLIGIALAFILGAVTLPPALVIGAQAYQAVNGSAVTSTSTVRGGDGTAAAPTFSFTSDPDTGMYRAGANSIGFATGGAGGFSIGTAGALTSTGAGDKWNWSGASTSAKFMHGANTGGDFYFGVESSAGGGIFTGTTAYATVLGTSAFNKPVQIAANNAVVATFASTGTTVGPLTATSLTLGAGSALSVYAKGTWTPADGSGAALTYTTYAARYTRIGDIVIANMLLGMPVTASGAAWRVCGLPATAFAGSGYADALGGFIQYTDANLAQLNVQVPQNSACMTLTTGAAGAAVTNANMSGKQIGVTVIYEAQ